MTDDGTDASSAEESESEVPVEGAESGELPSPSDLDAAFVENQEGKSENHEDEAVDSSESVGDDSVTSVDMVASEDSLNRSIESVRSAEMKWLAIDERFLSSGLRLLHLLPILAALLVALSRTFRDQSPNWWVDFVQGDSSNIWSFGLILTLFGIVVLCTYLIALFVTIRRIRLTIQSVKRESDLQELDGRDFRSVHGHSSLTSRINIVLGQHVLTAVLILLSVIFMLASIVLQTVSNNLNIQAELMTMGAAALLIGYGIHLVNLKDTFSTVKPYGLLRIYDPPVHPALLTHPFRDVVGTHLDPLLAAKVSGFIHDLEGNLIDGVQTEEGVQDRVLHLLYLEQHCGLKRADMKAALGEILDEEGVSRVLSEEWDETWRSLIAHSRDRIRPYFRLHDRLLHNAVDISEGKRPPGGLWFDIDIENLIEGEAHLFTFVHNGTTEEQELVVRIQTPDFSPKETHYSVRLPTGSMETLMGLESTAEVKSAMGEMFNDSKIIWQTLIPRTSGESTVTVRLEDKDGNLLSGKVATVQVQPDMLRRLRWWTGLTSMLTGTAAVLWLLILPILGFIGGF
ncbi:MAG TPA: hypothetical protein HA330_02530 [Candidatus Thalassarchaeaceae archaeon]|nr:MAG TPA: hypothetical protein D7H85_02535 [Candidatus Poseidoniales archaeon]HII48743.1 hypothetical protein [Candidatus Thalassarchaeaceae archaeon]